MSADDIAQALHVRGCSIVPDAGKFALVYPQGYGQGAASHTLLATTEGAALTEAWLWMHPDHDAAGAILTIIDTVAADYRLGRESILSRDRHEPVATARRVAMVLARQLTLASLHEIGEAFGREHTTARYATQSVAAQCETEKAFNARMGTLRAACAAAMMRRAVG